MNAVEGLKLYEDFYSGAEVLKLFALVNDLRSAGRRGQLQGKYTNYSLLDLKHQKKKT